MSVPSQLSVIVVTRQQPEELDGVLANLLNQDRSPDEIIVWDNDPAGSARASTYLRDRTVRYLCAGEDHGVAGGRNNAAATAHGDLLLFLADYVRFDKYTATNVLLNAFRPREVGGLAFQVRDASSKELVPGEFPAARPAHWGEGRQVCAFTPSAFAIRREAFETLGGFDETLFAGDEALDLAFRLTAAGQDIRYQPEILVNYRASMRPPEAEPAAYYLLRNRLYLAMKHLPMPLVVMSALTAGMAALLVGLREQQTPEFQRAVRSFRAESLWERAKAYRQAHPPTWDFVKRLQAREGRLLG